MNILAVTLESQRELKGLEILGKGDQISRIDADSYNVRSQNGSDVSYLVRRSGKEWACECPDHRFRQMVCKHIWAVYFSLNMRQRVITQVQPVVEIATPAAVVVVAAKAETLSCKFCGSSNVVKIGMRHNQYGNVQRMLCNDCKHKFMIDKEGFEKVKATPKAITIALDLYFKGVSQRKIVEHLKMFEGVEVTQPAVLKWIRRYVEVMKGYLDKFTPNLGGMWHSDEMMVKVRKTEPIDGENYSWAWNLLDHETRFLIASEVTKHRYIEDVRNVLQQAKKVSNGQAPDFIVTDKLPAYQEAVRKEFFTRKKPRTQHVKLKNIREGTNNNIVERLNGTVRERTKVMRGFDSDKTAETLMEGNRIYYNYLRPHQALEGKTPAEKAGIDLKLDGNKNKWQEIIKRGKRSKRNNNPKVIKEEK